MLSLQYPPSPSDAIIVMLYYPIKFGAPYNFNPKELKLSH